jgi:pimeloyl-ACP methyl ester carboxylesterase
MSSTPSQNLDHKPTSAWVTAAKYLGLAAVAFAVGAFVDHTMFGDARTSQLPPDYVPKCSGTETLGVTLEEACSRIEEAAGAAGARRKLTGTSTSYSCLPHYRVPLTGTDGRVVFPYHAEMDLTKGGPKITMAVVVIHGAMRDADNYFCSFYDLHKDQKFRTDEEVLVITPDFNYENDEGVEIGDAFWNNSRPWGDWRAGAHSSPKSGHGRTVSSYAVLDTFVNLLSETALFPKLDLISVVGHSAGGQTVQRYALSTALPPAIRTGLAVRYVVANPSSYGYLDSTRPVYKCGNCDCNPRECDCDAKCTPDGPIHDATLPFVRPPSGFSVADPKQFVCGHAKYNDWPYGLANRWGYTHNDVGYPMNVSLALYPERDVNYLVGQNDTCNDGLAECDGECWQKDNKEAPCMRNHMDNRCPAMLEGPWRKARGKTYMKFLKKYYGKDVHRFGIVPGCGHNATCIFASGIALAHVFRHPSSDELPDASDLYPPASFTMPTSSYPNIVRLLASEPDEAPEELPTEKP